MHASGCLRKGARACAYLLSAGGIARVFLRLVMGGTVIWPRLCLGVGLEHSTPPHQSPFPSADGGHTEVALLLEGEGRVESEGGGLHSAALR